MKTSNFAISVLVFLSTISLFAPYFAPYHYATQFRNYPLAPPMKIHFFYRSRGKTEFMPHVHPITRRGDNYINESDTCKIHFLTKSKFLTCECPCFIFGTDRLGRDILSRIIYGGRISLSIGLVGVLITALMGLIIGSIAGYFGGIVDTIIMRLTEVLMSLPSFFLLLSLSIVIPPGLSSAETFFLIVIILSFIGWAGFARVIRGMVASIASSDHVQAARASGSGTFRIIFYHIIPMTLGYTIVVITLTIPSYILSESALSMLGLGIREPDASWGNMLADALNISMLYSNPWILIPGLFIVLTVIAFNVLGEDLRSSIVVKESKQ